MTEILRSELAKFTHDEIVRILCGALRESIATGAPMYSKLLSDEDLALHVEKAVTLLEQLASLKE